VSYNDLYYSGGEAISNAFVQYFSSVFSQQSAQGNISNNYNSLSIDFNSCIISLNDVYEELNHLNK